MKPIPTANAMKPAPGKGISSFPTPVIKDTVIVEVVNAWKGDYQPLEYGTKWDDVPHASVQGSFPDHKLINQAPNSEDGQWVKRIWANDRVDQDTYNYAIKYSGGSDAHPIYIRTYVELRETYAPVPDLSPDPLFPNALLVEEEVQRQEDELDSRYVKVIRTYETLPGPIISSQRVNERGDLETVEVQEVAPSTPPDPDGLFVTQTQVIKEDVSKGTKTTATVPSYTQLLVKEKKEGLLGETVTTDDIVDPSTQPDSLSQSVVASVVQQTSATKAVKRTTTASGPTSLTKKSKDGKLLGNVTSTQSIVAPNANPDNPSNLILSSEVSQVDSGKAIKTNIVLNSTPTLDGKDKKGGLLGETTSTETIVPAGTSADPLTQTIVSSTVEPIDSVRSRKVTVEASGPTSLIGKRINQRGDIETINESIVPAGTNAGPDGLLVISSEVEPIDSAKSKLTITTVPSHTGLGVSETKSGLLGNTISSENIVTPGTDPSELTFTGASGVIESSVQQISATKARKVVVQSTGPVKLGTNTWIDSPIGTVKAIVEKSIVVPSTQPTANPADALTTIKDQIDRVDNVKSQRELVKVAGNWPINTGVDYDDQLGLGIYYTETIVNPDEYKNPNFWADISNTNYKPLDQWKSVKRAIDKEKISEALLDQWYKFPVEVDVSLPDKLLEIKVYWGKSVGETDTAENDFGAYTGSYNASLSSSSRDSASVNGDIYFNIEQGFKGAVSGNQHIFFIEIGSDGRVSSSEILARLNDLDGGIYSNWPYLQTRTENIVVISGGKSITKNRSQTRSVSINGFGGGTGTGDSLDVDVNARSINVPATLHGPLTIEKEEIGPEIPSELKPTYEVRPEQLAVTKAKINGVLQDAPTFPVGNYLYSSSVELYKWGFAKVTATTVNITLAYV